MLRYHARYLYLSTLYVAHTTPTKAQDEVEGQTQKEKKGAAQASTPPWMQHRCR